MKKEVRKNRVFTFSRARYRQNHKCKAQQTRRVWILEVSQKDKYELTEPIGARDDY